MKKIMGLYVLFFLAGCSNNEGYQSSFNSGGQYNTSKEIESFIEPKINDGSIHIGMSQDDLSKLCGQPANRSRSSSEKGLHEVWQYGNYGSSRYYHVYLFIFDNGILTSWKG
jgi:hypothetical protein